MEGGREGERETVRQRHSETETQRHRQTERKTDRRSPSAAQPSTVPDVPWAWLYMLL
eukprot:COSAG03_NODE_7829_length_868_cov_1.481144_1_plen_56_part_10